MIGPECVKVCSPSAQGLADPALSFGYRRSNRGALSQVLRKGTDAPDVHSGPRERDSGVVGSGLRTTPTLTASALLWPTWKLL